MCLPWIVLAYVLGRCLSGYDPNARKLSDAEIDRRYGRQVPQDPKCKGGLIVRSIRSS